MDSARSDDQVAAEDAVPGIVLKLRRALKRFAEPGDDAGWLSAHRVSLNEQVVVPDLARLVLTIGVGALEIPVPEKTRWAVAFKCEGRDCVLALQKFGPRLYVAPTAGEVAIGTVPGPAELSGLPPSPGDFIAALVDDVNRAVKILEREFLQPIARRQMERGAVTVANEYHTIRGMYSYFRAEATRRLAVPPDREAFDDPESPTGGLVAWMNARSTTGTESLYNRIAAVTAFFSLLEHVLVLLLAFVNFDPAQDQLLNFIGGKWSDKWKRVLPLTDATSKKLYDQLVDVAERHRNFFAHGGFGKAGTTLQFHLPGIGALPVALSDVADVPTFRIYGADHEALTQSLDELFVVLDAVEAWLATGPLALPMRYVMFGLPVPFDEGNRQAFAEALVDSDKFESLIEDISIAQDRFDNFES